MTIRSSFSLFIKSNRSLKMERGFLFVYYLNVDLFSFSVCDVAVWLL